MMIAVLAGTLVAFPLPVVAMRAQASPQVSVGGVVYAQYLYQLKDSANHVNNFDVTRAYINVVGRLGGGVGTRVTGDIYRPADGSLAYRLKYAYVTYTPANSPLILKIGQLHTTWLDWEEALWDYRVQGTMALEREGYVSSSDFGAGVDGTWRAERVNAQLAVVNGENYNRAPGDQRKDFMLRVSGRVVDTDDSSRVGGLRLTGYAQLGKPTGGGARQRFLGMVSYRSTQLTLAGQLARTVDGVSAGPELIGRVVSAYGVYGLPRTKVALLARYDVTDPDTGAPRDRLTRVIAGASYQVSPNLRLLGDWDHLSYQGQPTAAQEAVRSQALLQAQFTF